MRITPLTEKALVLEFGDEINNEVIEQIRCFDTALRGRPFPGFRASIPGYTTLTVLYDPVEVSLSTLPGKSGFPKVSRFLESLSPAELDERSDTAFVEVPVCYGGAFGPDLEALARQKNRRQDELIALHTAGEYRVAMIGFVPGFPYLTGMSRELAAPRRTLPRTLVPAGSVGIAGEQTGIYPLETPGGWQLIGRTPLRLFDADREKSSLLSAGDRVRFKRISIAEFYELLER